MSADYAAGPVEREVLDRLDALRPHLARATLLSGRLKLEHEADAAEALAAIGLPITILGHRGALLAANCQLDQVLSGLAEDCPGSRLHLSVGRHDVRASL